MFMKINTSINKYIIVLLSFPRRCLNISKYTEQICSYIHNFILIFIDTFIIIISSTTTYQQQYNTDPQSSFVKITSFSKSRHSFLFHNFMLIFIALLITYRFFSSFGVTRRYNSLCLLYCQSREPARWAA